MPEKAHSGHTKKRVMAESRSTRVLREMGPKHSSENCHELVLRLKVQAQCLEEVLADIRDEIDELESEEIIDRICEQSFEDAEF